MTILQPPKSPDPKKCELSAREVNEALPMPVPTAGRSSGGAAELGTIISGVFGYLFGKSKEKDCLKQQEAQYQKEVKEYNLQVEAERELNAQGFNMPSESSNQSMDTTWSFIATMGENLLKDAISGQQPIRTQNQQYSQQMHTYMSNVELYKSEKSGKFTRTRPGSRVEPAPAPIIEPEPVFTPKPAPILHDPRRLDPNLSHYEVLGIRQRENTKRYTKGLPQFPLDSPIWDGYNWQTSCTNGNYSPFAGSHDGKSSLLEGGLLPDSSGATIDPSHSGSDNCSSENFDRGFCFEGDSGNLDRCYNI